MKKHKIYAVGLLMVSVLINTTSCGFAPGGSTFSSPSDKFSITFPSGAGEVETEISNIENDFTITTYSKDFDAGSDEFRSYEVMVRNVVDAEIKDKNLRQILEIGLNGWEYLKETKIKDITIDGRSGIDSLRTSEFGHSKMTVRKVVFWSEAEKKLYVITVIAKIEKNSISSETEAFIKSFKLNA